MDTVDQLAWRRDQPTNLLLVFAIILTSAQISQQASFFGSSHVSLPLQDAKSTTDVSFRFKTSRAESLLVLVAGKTDYCLIILQAGTIKVHINLGAGESEISSPRGFKLNDLNWHEVKLIRNDGDLQLTIDNTHTTKTHLPGRYYELNIHYGVFLGGMGQFNEIFLGNQKHFRGCLESVYFNGIDVLVNAEESASSGGDAKVHKLQWECSKEFDATIDTPVSFLNEDSFISFPNWISRVGAVVNLKVKTVSENAIILYNTGHTTTNDFVSVEIRAGKVLVLMEQGNGVMELRHRRPVSDGQWHNLQVEFKQELLQVTIDGDRQNLVPVRGTNKHIDLTGRIYIGGIELNKKARAIRQGVKSGTEALQGCLREIELDGRKIGLPEVLESSGIEPQCVWEYPCILQPCPEAATCLQQGLAGFRCECRDQSCNSGGPSLQPTNPPKHYSGDFVATKSLQVEEGSQATITSTHLNVLLDYQNYAIKETSVLFYVVDFPKHGQLQVSVWQNKPDNIFTLFDLNSEKVLYINDGSEQIRDTIVFEIELSSTRENVLPKYLSIRQRFLLDIRILPINDPPQLNIALSTMIHLAANTARQLDPTLLQVTDPDNKIDQFIIYVEKNHVASGHLENHARQKITSFSLSELSAGNLYYVHRGPLHTSLILKAWDGEDYSSPVSVPVQAFTLELVVVNNTGLTMQPGATALITPANLTLTTNAPEQDFDIRMDVIQGPTHGKIQRLRGNGKWVTTRRFSKRQIEKEKVRYIHTKGHADKDHIKFTASIDGTPIGSRHTFYINFVNTNIQLINNIDLNLENIRESVITDSNLLYGTSPSPLDDSLITYTITSPPVHGTLIINHYPPRESHILKTNSNFTQVEILSGRLKYKLSTKIYEIIDDKFSFVVSSPIQSSAPQMFSIHYKPGDTSVDITIESIEVEEGGRKIITNKYLDIDTQNYHNFVFNVTSEPIHGWLSVLGTNGVDIERAATSYFTSIELANNKILYTHDDSESRRDSFHFVASSTEIGGHGFQYSAVFHIHVILRNDQTPTRAVDTVFHVVEGGQKLVTNKDLLFIDMDIDTKPENIKFESRATPNGELVYSEHPEIRVSEFTQKDINENKILFKHKGSNFGRILIWVNDGQLWVSTELKVRASPPFIKIRNNTGIIVQRGDSQVVSATNLSAQTNINKLDDEIIFHVVEGPTYGQLLIQDLQVTKFTQADINNQQLEYRNNDNASFNDDFKFQVCVESMFSEKHVFTVDVFPETYWDNLKIGSNKTLLVEEGTSVRITQYDLKVIHSQMAPSDLLYTVEIPPKYGYLEIDPSNYKSSLNVDNEYIYNSGSVSVFDQSVINEGRLHYVQSISNQSTDHFIFDVTNGVSHLNNLVFHLIIIPQNVYIETRPLTLEEGGNAVLSQDNIHVITQYYEDKIKDYLIVSPPKHGFLVLNHRNITIFSADQLEKKYIKYIHDGSDTTADELVLVARTGGLEWPDLDKTSVAATLHIHITPVNDVLPYIVNNTGLVIWAGATVPIQNLNLGVHDGDTSDLNITYRISSPHCGLVSLSSRPAYPVSQFSQRNINEGQVLFTHSGCLSGGFSVQVTDGVHTIQPEDFSIRVSQPNLVELVNQQLSVFPGMESVISSASLVVSTTDFDSSRKIMFLITSGPVKGDILYLNDEGGLEKIHNFTQASINASRIFYKHQQPFSELTSYDYFNFEAMADYAPYRLKAVFNIVISVTSMIAGGIDRYLSLSPVTCEEGGTATIYPHNLNTSNVINFIEKRKENPPHTLARLHMMTSYLPLRGQLTLDGRPVLVGQSFTQSDLDSGALHYSHDDSDTQEDRLGFKMYLDGDTVGYPAKQLLLYQGHLQFIITPVNDRMPFLVTKNPSMVVVRRQQKIINVDMLEVRDPDTNPQNIKYTILDNSLQGKICFLETPNQSINSFTQKDINTDRVVYVHDGASSQTQFYFSVTDGRFQARETGLSRHFRIHVIPLTLELVNHSSISLEQGTTTAYIRPHNIGAKTNGQRGDIRYNVTIAPKGGKLLLEDSAATAFTQLHIDREELVYMQTDMSRSNDSFVLDISNMDNKIVSVEFNISVIPLVKQIVPFVAAVDNSTPLTTKHIDASKLAGLTNSNPAYRLLNFPKYGKIKRIIRTSRTRESKSHRDRQVVQFTHEDIKNGVIYFVGSNSVLPENVTDYFRYQLLSPGVQPATGVFELTILHRGMTSWNPLPNVTPTGLQPVHGIADRKDLVIAITVIASILLMIVSAVLVAKCRKGNHKPARIRNSDICSADSARRKAGANGCMFDNTYGTRDDYSIQNKGVDQLDRIITKNPLPPHQSISPQSLRSERTGGGGYSSRPALPLPQLASHNQNISDSDSWMESSRSRETSPSSSSIPPGLPAFRVIPLCESESSGTHMSDPPLTALGGFLRKSSNVGSDLFTSDRICSIYPPPSETESNPSDNVLESGRGQPMLRRNQYWV